MTAPHARRPRLSRRTRLLLVDGLFAYVVCGATVVGTRGEAWNHPSGTPIDVTAYVMVALAALSLVVRRVQPMITLAVATVATSAYLFLGYPYGPILVSLMLAVYAVARYRATRPAGIASGIAVLFLVGHVVAGRGMGPGLLGVVPVVAWVVAPFAVGVVVRVNRDTAARLRADWARRHADEERLLVAREVHDIVGHGLAAIAMQADIALHVLPKRPEHAEVALTAIGRTSREALDELKVALAFVRGEQPHDRRAPLPGLARLDALVARMADAGVPVRVEVVGQRRPLPDTVDLAAYRVVQESLTNVLRHAGPATVSVRLEYEPDALAITVTDTGRGAPVADPLAGPGSDERRGDARRGDARRGDGIAGMDHRVTALAGTFETGSPPGAGGFRVSARIPTG